jgi:hypothetical protein
MPEQFGLPSQNPFEEFSPSFPESEKSPSLKLAESESIDWLTEYQPEQFAELDEAIRSNIVDDFWHNSDLITSNERMEWFEAFLASEKIDPKKAALLVRDLPNDEERAKVGLYLLQVLDIGKYAVTFQACWFALSRDDEEYKKQNPDKINPYRSYSKRLKFKEKITKARTSQAIIDEFLAKSNEYLYLIAPFALDEIYDHDVEFELTETGWQETISRRQSAHKLYLDNTKYTKEQKAKEKNPPTDGLAPHHKQELLDKFGPRPETTNLLQEKIINGPQLIEFLDTALDFLDANGWPADQTAEEKLKTDQQLKRYKEAVAQIVLRAATSHSTVLIPYISKLQAHKLISDESTNRCFEKIYQSLPHENFQSPQEQAAEKVLKQRLYEKYPTLSKYSYRSKMLEDPEFSSDYGQIREAHLKRAAQHQTKNFKEYTKTFSADQQFQILQAAIDYDLPLFLYLNPADIDSSVRNKLFTENKGSLLRDPQLQDVKLFIDAGFENEATTELIGALELFGLDDIHAKKIIQNIDTFLELFSPGNQEKILNALKNNAAELWVENLDYAFDNEIATFDEIANSLADDPRNFVKHYEKLHSYWHKLSKAGKKPETDIETIDALTKETLLSETQLVLDYPKIFQRFFTDEEILNQVSDYLQTCENTYFAPALLEQSKTKPFIKKTVKVLKDAIINNPHLYNRFAIDLFEELQQLLSAKQILELAIKNAGHIEYNRYGSRKFIQFLVKHPIGLKQFTEASLQNGSLQTNLVLMMIVKEIQGSDNQTKNNKSTPTYFSSMKPQDRQRLNNLYSNLLAAFLTKSKEDPKLVLNREALYNSDIPNDNLTTEMISDAISSNPSLLTPILASFKDAQGYNSDEWGRKTYKTLSDPRITTAIAANIRQIAFSEVDNNKTLREFKAPTESIELLEKINPLAELLAQDELESDFYQTAIARISHNPFYPLFKAKLNRIAESELKRNGPRTEMNRYEPNQEFVSLVRRMQLLNVSNPIHVNKEHILELNPGDFKDIAPYLEFISYYRLDKDLYLDFGEQSLNKIKEILAKRIFSHLVKIFGLDNLQAREDQELKIPRVETIEALIIYFTNSCKNDPNMERASKKYVAALLQGDVTTWRIWEGEEPTNESTADKKIKDLKQSGLVPEQMTLAQYQTWNQNQTTDLSEMLEYGIDDIVLGFNQIFDQAIADEHITSDSLNTNQALVQRRHDALSKPMIALNKELKDISKKMQKQKKAKKAGDEAQYVSEQEISRYEELRTEQTEYLDANQDKLDEAKAQLYIHALRNISSEELENQSLYIGKTKVAFKQAFKILEKVYSDSNPDFLQDIRRLQNSAAQGFEKIFGTSKISRSELTLTDQFDPMIYIRIGSEPVESCQNYDSTSDLNFGLLSYSMDPNVRIIQIFDEDQQIITRAALRLLADEDGNPQLFLERVYSTNSHHKINEAVINFAKEKAKKLKVNLYGHGERAKDLIKKKRTKLQSSGSRAPYVYTDAGGGKRKNGVYKIQSAAKLN